MSGDFVWRDAGRVVVFRRGGIEASPEILGEHGFERFALLSTERALAGSPRLADAADAIHEVAPGPVPAAAAALLDRVGSESLVALGGGRAIDTAKAIAAVSGAPVAAIPTTLSGAEITGIHRLPEGAESRARGLVRPRLAIADPEAMTSLPEPRLRVSAMNSLAHGADSLYTSFANPVSRMAALRGAELIATSLDEEPGGRDRAALAEGSLLCAYAIDSGLFALHHVICQTLVRICGSPHADTNAAVLPRSMAYMVPRAPQSLAALAAAIGAELDRIEARILALGGYPPGLGALAANRDRLDVALDAMLARPELAFGPEPPDRDQLAALVASAW